MELICKSTGGVVRAEGEVAERLIESGSFEKKPEPKPAAKKPARKTATKKSE